MSKSHLIPLQFGQNSPRDNSHPYNTANLRSTKSEPHRRWRVDPLDPPAVADLAPEPNLVAGATWVEAGSEVASCSSSCKVAAAEEAVAVAGIGTVAGSVELPPWTVVEPLVVEPLRVLKLLAGVVALY
ncbi:hypothetical protein QQP08_019865 [Theobroma cacao]|nr:hypothetical protein QQP08_019865 [Theobroma cacao]